MIAARDIAEEKALGERFLAALGKQDWAELQSFFTEDAKFRALVPPALREAEGAAASEYFRRWFGVADRLVLLDSDIRRIQDRLAIRYRFRSHEDRWYVVEQQIYCDVRDGRIARMDLLCSGFRPEAQDEERSSEVKTG
jgi:SnoaL-like domain